MSEPTHVTVAQLPIIVGEPQHNRALVSDAVVAAPPGIVVLPELVSSGYCFRDREEARSLAEPLDGPTVTLLRELSTRTGSTIVASLAILPDGGAHPDGRIDNVAVAVEDGELLGTYVKAHLWGREPEFFRAGDAGPTMIASRRGRLALIVCYDLEFPEFTRMAALQGADLIAAPVNWPLEPRPAEERAVEQVVVQAAARASRVAIAVCDRVGAERTEEDGVGSDWVGGSIIVGPDGFPLTRRAYGREALLTALLDLEASRHKSLGPHNDTVRDRRPELYVLD